jgi:hypothetical protein
VICFSAIIQPTDDRLDIAFAYAAPVLVSQQILEHDLHREWQLRCTGEAVLLRRLQGKVFISLGADCEFLAAFETVEAGQRVSPLALE